MEVRLAQGQLAPGAAHQWKGGKAAGQQRSRHGLGLFSVLLGLLFVLAGCGESVPPQHLALQGPGLRRMIAQGSQGTLYSWWLPASAEAPKPRLLLWDGVHVGIGDPTAVDQTFTPLISETTCAQLALAPDAHAFACSQAAQGPSTVLIQALDDLERQPQALVFAAAPFTWAPDSHLLAYVRQSLGDSQPTCSVVVSDTTAQDASSTSAQALLAGIPFTSAFGKAASSCPIVAMSWSPDGARLALTLATTKGVDLEVLRLKNTATPPGIESQNLLPGVVLQGVDSLATPSLFWSPDGKLLAVLTGYQRGSEDGLFLLPAGEKTPIAGPNLTDTGQGASLAFSPNSQWLAAGTVGSQTSDENATLQVYDLSKRSWRTLGGMLVNGPTLAWTPDNALLAAPSGARQGIALWSWPAGTLAQVIPNQDAASLDQLLWSPDGSVLLFSDGSQSAAPTFDELYAQAFPVPAGSSRSITLPSWFARVLGLLPATLLGLGATLLVIIGLAMLVVLLDLGLSRRKRALIRWTLAVGALLFSAVMVTYADLPDWMGRLYLHYSASFCGGTTRVGCNSAGVLSILTVGGPILLGIAIVVFGALVTGRRSTAVSGEILPKPRPRPPFAGPLLPKQANMLDEMELLEAPDPFEDVEAYQPKNQRERP